MKMVKFGRIDDILWRNVKAQAALEGKPVQDWVAEALREKLTWYDFKLIKKEDEERGQEGGND